ncbi:MAG TPA: folylpolyglutamate synthase/dihydrofolate synthase family protein [Mobilitalea sp.]|nr:folylpolyglutamate synthase/dihydrofolate synthase family protein [Mobilitalea sp.]
MIYEEAREFIQNSNRYGIVPGLETITELLNRLGNPQESLKIIHVAGTNGKGSTSSFLASILAAAGYRVGRYISPAVFSYRERIQINNLLTDDEFPDKVRLNKENDKLPGSCSIGIEYITRQGICDAIVRIKPVCEAMVSEGFAHPTSFEIETAMMFMYLLQEQVDFAVVEVGMGGRLDATNVIKHPVCSVITSISMDHMQYLGDTIDKIAREKAGIIKSGVPVVTCRQEPKVIKVFDEVSKRNGASLYISDYEQISEVRYSPEETDFTLTQAGIAKQYKIKLLGEYQVSNAVLAVRATQVMNDFGYKIDEAAIRTGLTLTKWSGRFEIVAREPYLIIDGAHNADAALTLRNSIQLYFTNRRIIFIIGVLADKDYRSILNITSPLADKIITLTPDSSRALSSDKLAEVARSYCSEVIDAGSVDNAVRIAYQEASVEDVIIAFGSLSYLGDLVSALGIRKDEQDD